MGGLQSCLNSRCRSILFGSTSAASTPPMIADGKKEYSWDKRRKETDLAKFTVENVSGGEVGRMPGDIAGEQMIVRNCENCCIYLFDHTNTVTIDDCKNCKVFVAPTQGSVFVRDCSDCVVVAACGQFRTRDCKKIDVFLCSATQPIIEATTAARFACFQFNYPSLKSQFAAAGLSPYNNLWWNVHDFTPVAGERNWSLLGEMYKVHDFLPLPETDKFKNLEIATDRDKSVVPLTVGSRRRDHDETSLVLLFYDDDESQGRRGEKMVAMMEEYAEIDLIKTRRLQIENSDSERIFDRKEYRTISERGPLIAMQFGGPDCVVACADACRALNGDYAHGGNRETLTYSSTDAASGQRDIHNLFNFADMQLGI